MLRILDATTATLNNLTLDSTYNIHLPERFTLLTPLLLHSGRVNLEIDYLLLLLRHNRHRVEREHRTLLTYHQLDRLVEVRVLIHQNLDR